MADVDNGQVEVVNVSNIHKEGRKKVEKKGEPYLTGDKEVVEMATT